MSDLARADALDESYLLAERVFNYLEGIVLTFEIVEDHVRSRERCSERIIIATGNLRRSQLRLHMDVTPTTKNAQLEAAWQMHV